MIEANLLRYAVRVDDGKRDHGLKAFLAAAIAKSISDALERGTRDMILFVAGFGLSKYVNEDGM